MNNKLVKKLMFSLIALVIILSAYLTMNSFANSVPAEFLSSGYHLYEYDIRSKMVNGEQRYNITVNDLRREYAILCCQHGTALPSGDPIPQPAIDAGLDGESITEAISEIGKVTNSTKDFYSQYDGKVTKTAAWYKVTETKDATPEEAYILAEMVLDTQVLDLELIYYTDENGNVINATKIKLVKNSPYYPKSYEECCDVLSMCYATQYNLRYFTYEHGYYEYATTDKLCSLQDKLNIIGKLIICRNAYWKIAGDYLELDKPWEPDWTNENQHKYGLYNELKYSIINPSQFAFPTEEMRDEFQENFKELIEKCKELL